VSVAVERCLGCHWSAETRFRYRGGVPVEHPVCPACGGQPQWTYHFDRTEIEHSPEEMAAFVHFDDGGFPEDRSPAVLAIEQMLDRLFDGPQAGPRTTNHEGVVDVELRPHLDHARGRRGVAVVANVGQAVYSIALVELLRTLGASEQLGTVIVDTSTYGRPVGAAKIFPFGTHVGLFFEHVIELTSFEDGSWKATYESCLERAAQLARGFADARRLGLDEGPTPLSYPPPETDRHEDGVPLPNRGLDDVGKQILGTLLHSGPDEAELTDRVGYFIANLGLETVQDDSGAFVFALNSARVRVFLERRGRHLLVRFNAVILDRVPLEHQDADLSGLLTTLNNQITFGRCVVEPADESLERARVVLDKSLLAADLDLSEFSVTLAVFAEQADTMDDILQEGIGGLRADQLEALQPNAHDKRQRASDLERLVHDLATEVPSRFVRLGSDKARQRILHMLEELSLPANEDDSGVLWFDYGSARYGCGLWHDERATFLEVRASVLRDIQDTTGLAETLNEINRTVHFGAFALSVSGDSVQLIETILADDLSLEELAYCLVTIGQLADDYDDLLKARFGGKMGSEVSP
jgi:hypothetical protein